MLQREFVSPTRLNDLEVDPPPARVVAEDRKKEGTLQLLLEDRPVRTGGNVVGQVRVDLNSKITAKMIAVRLMGAESQPGNKNSRDLFQGAPGYNRHGLLVVVHDGSKGDKLHPGQYSWPFSINVPLDTPFSFSDAATRIQFTLEVFVDIPFWPDMNASYPVEIFPSGAQHAKIVHGLKLCSTPFFRPMAPLLCGKQVTQLGSTGICCFKSNFAVSLSAADPVILPFQDGQYTIAANLEVHPANAPITSIVAVIQEVTRQGAHNIATFTTRYNLSGNVPLTFTLTLAEKDLQAHLHHLYGKGIIKSSLVTCYSFTSHYASRNYVLRVTCGVDGFAARIPNPIVAEIPVLAPAETQSSFAPAQQAPQVAGSFYGATVNGGYAPAVAAVVGSSRNIPTAMGSAHDVTATVVGSTRSIGANEAPIVLDASHIQIIPSVSGSASAEYEEKVPEMEDLPPAYVP